MGSLDLIAGKLGLVSKNNNNNKGFDGIFTDDVRVKEELTLTLSTPDTYVEDGNYVNDHTIFNPKYLTIEGEVGEVYIKESSVLNEYFRLSDKLGVVGQYIPQRTATQLTQINGIVSSGINYTRQYDKVINDIDYVKGSFVGNTSSVQKKFIDFVNLDLYEKGMLISIETSLGYFSDMKLVSATITKDSESTQSLKYSLVFKKWRVAKTKLSAFESVTNSGNGTSNNGSNNKSTGDAKVQTAKTSDKGQVQGKPNVSLATKLKKLF